MANDFYRGRRVLISGGSAGIGVEAASQLVAQGAHVCITARGEERLKGALARLEADRVENGQVITSVAMDVVDDGAVHAGVESARATMGGIDLLINNAGYARTSYSHEVSEAKIDEMLEVNYKGMVRVVQAVLPKMMERRQGHIANVSSLLGLMGMFGYGAYAASKFAIVGYTQCLRQEMLEYGVGVSIFYPPTTDTPGLELENRDKLPESWAVESDANKTAEPGTVARAMLDGIRKGRFEIYGNGEAVFIGIMNRFAPGIVRKSLDKPLLKYLAAEGRR